MKRFNASTLKTVLTVIIAACFSSCAIEEASDDTLAMETRGFMEVEVTENLGTAADRMETVRFFVFKNVAAGIPVLELNQKFDIPDAVGGNEVSKFKIVLEATMRLGGNNEKMVVAVVNEPGTMTPELDAVSDYSSLGNTGLDLTLFLNEGQTALQAGKAMPMTGVVWTDKVYPTLGEAEADPEPMKVLRAVARVDIYVCQEAGLGLEMAEGSAFSLSRSYDREYLVRHATDTRTFGKIQTVTSGFKTGSVTLTASDGLSLPEFVSGQKGRLVASFYTAERTCAAAGNADKLQVGIDIATNEGAPRRGTLVIDRLNREGVETDVLEIARNNIYEIIVTVGTNAITAEVNDWSDEDITSEL